MQYITSKLAKGENREKFIFSKRAKRRKKKGNKHRNNIKNAMFYIYFLYFINAPVFIQHFINWFKTNQTNIKRCTYKTVYDSICNNKS